MEQLVKINKDMGRIEYEMYQDIPYREIGSENDMCGKDYSTFQTYLEQCIKNETIPDSCFHDATTNRYIYYVDDYPIGEVGIRTSLNDFWINKGSQLFYKIRISERRKGYGMRMMKLALEECKKLGFRQVRANCNDINYGSQKLIMNCGGKVDVGQEHYKTHEGTSSSYVIKIEERKLTIKTNY